VHIAVGPVEIVHPAVPLCAIDEGTVVFLYMELYDIFTQPAITAPIQSRRQDERVPKNPGTGLNPEKRTVQKKTSCCRINTTGGFHMKRKWTNIKELESEILRMRNEGRTRQEIADALGLEKEQIKNCVKRYNRRQREPQKIVVRKGRPRTRPLSEPEAMSIRIRELEREVDLYRSFLQAVGRR
jgi:hypothetical protein